VGDENHSEETIRIVLDGLRGEDSCAVLLIARRCMLTCTKGVKAISGHLLQTVKGFVKADRRRLAGDTSRAANTEEVIKMQEPREIPSDFTTIPFTRRDDNNWPKTERPFDWDLM